MMQITTAGPTADAEASSPPLSKPKRILIGIHGVGSPPVGEVANAIIQGFAAAAHPGMEVHAVPLLVSVDETGNGKTRRYEGIRTAGIAEDVQEIWEVNWSDLKGFPDSSVGSLFYAVKALLAMVQISDRGWGYGPGVGGPILMGFVFRLYICVFALSIPLAFLTISFAYIGIKGVASGLIILSFTLFASILFFALKAVDRLIAFSLFPLWLGASVAIWILCAPSSADVLLIYSIRILGAHELFGGAIVAAGVGELFIRWWLGLGRLANGRASGTAFRSRAGILILAAAVAGGAYGALVNAAGFYGLSKLFDWKLANPAGFTGFECLFLKYVGYNLARLELINGGVTFSVGLFLLGAVGYQLFRISVAPENNQKARGESIQNCLNIFVWLVLVGFIVVFTAVCADHGGALDALNIAELTGLRTPLEIYLASATRVVPFLIPAIIPPMRVGLNVAADVLLYILQPNYPLSLRGRSQQRLATLLDSLSSEGGEADITVVAHSQGTVIARDVLSSNRRGVQRLVTAGSPLTSLYERFLGIPVSAIEHVSWINFYRGSDYVGGPISCAGVTNILLGGDYPSAHFFYFQNRKVMRATL